MPFTAEARDSRFAIEQLVEPVHTILGKFGNDLPEMRRRLREIIVRVNISV